MVENKRFNPKFDIDILIEKFDIKKFEYPSSLDNWWSKRVFFTSEEEETVVKLSKRFDDLCWSCNDEEFKIQLLGIFFFYMDLDVKYEIKTYFERRLARLVKDIRLNVMVNCFLGKPTLMRTLPVKTYFILQVFKKTKSEKIDAQCEMLTAMLIAQDRNKDNKPIYGCWIDGPDWYFAVLEGSDYNTSRSYNATSRYQMEYIVSAFRTLKTLILNR